MAGSGCLVAWFSLYLINDTTDANEETKYQGFWLNDLTCKRPFSREMTLQ